MNLEDAIRSRAAAFTVTATAGLLEVDPRTVTRACEEGQLPCLRVGRRLLVPRLPLLVLLGVGVDGETAADSGPTARPALA